MYYSLAEGLFKATLVTYALSLSHYIWQLGSKREWVKKAASWLALAGLTFHTGGLIARYIAAGMVEVEHREAVGEVLTGLDRFYTYIMHPPYTNLYESMVFVAWALMLSYVIVERKYMLRPLGIAATALAVLIIGLAGFATQKEIEPLVPALQSWWILIHVWFVFLAYSLFTLASFSAVLYLVKNKVDTRRLAGVVSVASAVTLALVGGKALFTGLAFTMTPMGWHQGKLVHVMSQVAGMEKAVRWNLPVAGAGPLLALAILGFAVAGVLLLREAKTGGAWGRSSGFWALLVAFAATTAMVGVVVTRIAQGEVDASLAPPTGVEGPYYITFKSNQYAMALVTLSWVLTLAVFALRRWRDKVENALPEPRKLDDVTYRIIAVGFPLISIGIVLGGVWAYFSWGRFWGWDPKETWALVTWTVYAIYLHTRITYGWAGNRAAAIAVAGFAVVIFTYMGVNLGLTGEGLHTYGGG